MKTKNLMQNKHNSIICFFLSHIGYLSGQQPWGSCYIFGFPGWWGIYFIGITVGIILFTCPGPELNEPALQRNTADASLYKIKKASCLITIPLQGGVINKLPFPPVCSFGWCVHAHAWAVVLLCAWEVFLEVRRAGGMLVWGGRRRVRE